MLPTEADDGPSANIDDLETPGYVRDPSLLTALLHHSF
jgi:hypothetical protein